MSDFCDSDVPGPAPEVEPPRPAPGSSSGAGGNPTALGNATGTSSLGGHSPNLQGNPSMDTSRSRMQFYYDQSFSSNQVTSVDLNDNFNHDNQHVQPQEQISHNRQPQVLCWQIINNTWIQI